MGRIIESLYRLNESIESKLFLSRDRNNYTIKDSKGNIVSKASYYDYSNEDFDWILIANVETIPEYRGKGLATKLMNRIETDLQRQFPDKGIYLLVEQNNDKAINLYKKLDYDIVKEYSIEDTPYYVMAKGNADINQLKEMNFK